MLVDSDNDKYCIHWNNNGNFQEKIPHLQIDNDGVNNLLISILAPRLHAPLTIAPKSFTPQNHSLYSPLLDGIKNLCIHPHNGEKGNAIEFEADKDGSQARTDKPTKPFCCVVASEE